MITDIECQGFRCLEDGVRSLSAGRTLVLGRNGAGKTSLLEALYLSLTTRSFRTAHLRDCCRTGKKTFLVRAEVEGPGRWSLETGWGEGRAWHRVNGSRTAVVDHLRALGVLVWSSERADSFGLLPQHRRVLLDRGILVEDPQRLAVWKKFGKVLRQKRELLIRGEGTQMPAWNRLFAEAGSILIAYRKAYVLCLQQTLEEVVERTGLRWPGPRLSYRASPPEAEQGEEAFYEVLEGLEAEELRRGRCLTGPQRDEVQLLWEGREMRRVASQGEKKSAGLTLLAAQGEIARSRDREPILLLDDCDAELDRDRLERLWMAFEGMSQLVATSNREEAWKGVPMDHVWHLPGDL